MVVYLRKKCPESALKLRKREGGLAAGPLQVAVEVAQEHVVHRAKEPLDPASSARLTWCSEDELDLKVGRHLLHVLRSKVRTVVGIEHAWDAANWPVRILLAPDALPERQGCTQHSRGFEAQVVSQRPLGYSHR